MEENTHSNFAYTQPLNLKKYMTKAHKKRKNKTRKKVHFYIPLINALEYIAYLFTHNTQTYIYIYTQFHTIHKINTKSTSFHHHIIK